jgi:FkbM family methyltransferase
VTSIWHDESNRGQRARRLLFFVGWQLWKRILHTPVTARLLNGFRIEVWPDCDVSPAALYYSLPNARNLSFLRQHLHGGTFLDVGANIGLVSLLVADRVEHALLFEPNPLAVERATRNLQRNKLKFEVFPKALSDTIGTVQFENIGGPSACNRTVDGFTSALPTITVQRTTFDQFLREHRLAWPPISAVKVDVEGHENSVLRGMKEFLKRDRPKLVMFEYLARTNIREVLDTFREVGYSVFELSPSGPLHATAQVTPLQDLFACPDELTAEFGIPRLA